MDSIFRTLISMPLFQGMEEEHLWNVLGKAKMNFFTLNAGETAISQGDTTEEIIFLLKGKLQYRFQNSEAGFFITEWHCPPMMTGLFNLYGFYKKSPYTLVATEESSILKFPKKQFFEFLQSEPLLLLNYINYLSTRAQRPLLNILSGQKAPVFRFISNICATILNPGGKDPVIHISHSVLQNITGLTSSGLSDELVSLEQKGLIRVENSEINILSRQGFIPS